ncbi:hypothetical protein GCM10010185_53880 [Saccharothrix coeruleofusca]|uniref:Tetratricopeptide repeat protein n=1 Tax=Saccharothrix coeruleofusca TaxID=33919 RepID=A0A918ARC6_9PSEU|nr:hypothetical protein GCM10010185_53880 [Saccharothrix coeruleofusca]
MDVEVPGRSKWQSQFAARARQRFPEKIVDAVANSDDYRRSENVPRLATLLRGALVAPEAVESHVLAGLVELSFSTFFTTGSGTGFSEHREFLTNALALIDVLHERGAATSALLLSAARFQARLSNGTARRRGFIERAVDTATTPDELVAARLTLAKYRIDTSQYRAARKQLSLCREVLATGAAKRHATDVEVTTGVLYYYTAPARSRCLLEAVVSRWRDGGSGGPTDQPVATALHYLGRLAADDGDHVLAIRFYVRAEELSDDFLHGHGFYHQRIAELLVERGAVSEAAHHLITASETFARLGEVSVGSAVLDSTWARFHVRLGELEKAERILRRGIEVSRAHIGPRAELLLLAQLLVLHAKQRAWATAARIAVRGVWLYARTEITDDPLSVWSRLTAVARRALSTARPSRSTRSQRPPEAFSCPCGEPHDRTTVELG